MHVISKFHNLWCWVTGTTMRHRLRVNRRNTCCKKKSSQCLAYSQTWWGGALRFWRWRWDFRWWVSRHTGWWICNHFRTSNPKVFFWLEDLARFNPPNGSESMHVLVRWGWRVRPHDPRAPSSAALPAQAAIHAWLSQCWIPNDCNFHCHEIQPKMYPSH